MIANFISNIVFSLIIPGLAFGVLLMIASIFIPPAFLMYKLPVQIFGVIILIFFLFQAGRASEFNKYEEERLKQALVVQELKTKSEQINTETVIKYVDRIKIVEKLKEVKTNVYITKEADAACVINPSTSLNTSRMLNSVAKGRVPDAPVNPDGTTK